jgi:hypothetical protein
MRLPWQRKETGMPNITATEARAQSELELQKAKERWPEVREVSGSLRLYRRRADHFAEMLEATFKESR